MKIGLITIYQVPNFGSVLQAFATQCILEQLGHECVVINYKYPNEWHYRHGFARPNRIRQFLYSLGLKASHRKGNYLKKFCKEHLHLTRQFDSLDDLKQHITSDFDAFVVGSDQVWNAHYLKGDSVFLLSFCPKDRPRFSFASSFAMDILPERNVQKYRSELSLFKALSVRETKGIDIINQQLGIPKNVYVCLDPTLLLVPEQWRHFIPRSGSRKQRPYILFYMWAYAFEPRPYIFKVLKHFAEKIKDCDIIALEGYAPASEALGLNMVEACDSSIPQFMDLFENADLVVTSSFHGTAFALNFSRPLISIVPGNDGDDRQYDLLKSVDAEQCALKVGDDYERVNPYYDTDIVSTRLQARRCECIEWIENNIVE